MRHNMSQAKTGAKVHGCVSLHPSMVVCCYIQHGCVLLHPAWLCVATSQHGCVSLHPSMVVCHYIQHGCVSLHPSKACELFQYESERH